MRKFLVCFGIGALLAACSATQVASATQLATDAAAVYSDLSAAQQQLAANNTVSSSELSTINTAITKVNSDITAMNAAGASTATVTAIIADINTAIQDFGPLAPEITALIGVAGDTPTATTATVVRQSTVNSLQADLSKWRSDAGTRVSSK